MKAYIDLDCFFNLYVNKEKDLNRILYEMLLKNFEIYINATGPFDRNIKVIFDQGMGKNGPGGVSMITDESLFIPSNCAPTDLTDAYWPKQAIFLFDFSRLSQDFNSSRQDGLFIGNKGREYETLSLLTFPEYSSDDNIVSVQYQNIALIQDKESDSENKYVFDSWAKLKTSFQRYTDVVIHDRYLLTKNEHSSCEQNLVSIANELKRGKATPFNLVMVAYYNQNKKNEESKSKAKERLKGLPKKLKGKSGIIKSITIVAINFNNKNIIDSLPKDRFIATNYSMLRSQDSFLFWEDDGKVKTRTPIVDLWSFISFTFYNFANSYYFDEISSVLHDIRYENDIIILPEGNQADLNINPSNLIDFP